jgi:hypothetical protein
LPSRAEIDEKNKGGEGMRIELGAMAKPLREQLAGHIEEKALSLLEMDNDAINRLHLRGYLSDTATKVARHRLVKAIQKEFRKG